MEIAIGILGLLTLGFGAWVFVLIRSQGVVREEAREATSARDVLAAENDRLGEESRRVREELIEATSKAEESSSRVVTLSVENAEIKERLSGAQKRYLDLVNDEKRLKDAFKAMGAETLKENTEQLGRILTARLEDADKLSQGELDERKVAIESLVKPIRETLAKTHEQIVQLDERVRASGDANSSLREETARLTKALSRPEIRGRYGEIQLRRVAELAGMTSYCDFLDQDTKSDDDDKQLRPDMVVTLPNDRVVIVDAKANFKNYFEAVNAETDKERQAFIKQFAKNTTDQVKKLADKKYWALYKGKSPEFVVMFIPGDHFLDAALSENSELIEIAALQNVILATPSTLIGLLRAVAVGWRDHELTQQAEELRELGSQLHQRACTAFDHIFSLGKLLNQTSRKYDELVGSVDGMLVPTLKRFEDAKVTKGKKLPELKPVHRETRLLKAASEIDRETGEIEKPSDDADAQEV